MFCKDFGWIPEISCGNFRDDSLMQQSQPGHKKRVQATLPTAAHFLLYLPKQIKDNKTRIALMLTRNTTSMLLTTLANSTESLRQLTVTEMYQTMEPFFVGVDNTTYRFFISQYYQALQNLTMMLRTGMLYARIDNTLSLVPTEYDRIKIWLNPYNDDELMIFSRARNQPAKLDFEQFIINRFDNFTRDFGGELNPHIKGVTLGVFFTIISFAFILLLLSKYLSARRDAREMMSRYEAGEEFPEVPTPGCYETFCGGANFMARLMRAKMRPQDSVRLAEEERITVRR